MNVDQNSYYRLSTAAAKKSQLSMGGTYPFLRDEEGLVTWGSSDSDAPTQQWQLFPVGPSTFMLRTKASGPNGYLAADKDGDPVPRIRNRPETDDSMLWKFGNWGNGTFYLSNLANGGAYHLEFRGAGLLSMSKNITQPQPGQAFSFDKLQEINDPAFSTVRVPPSSRRTRTSTFSSTIAKTSTAETNTIVFAKTAPVISTPTPTSTSTSTSTSTLTSTLTSTSTSTSSSSLLSSSSLSSSSLTSMGIPLSSGISSPISTPTSSFAPSLPTVTAQAQRAPYKLSPSAAMGLGVAVGVFGLITITAISLFIYQRWGQSWGSLRPESRHYRRAKMWDGFTPAEKNMSRPSLRNVSPVGQRYLAELPESPAAVFSPMMLDGHMSWNSHASWLAYPPASPGWPITPGTPPAEMPV